MVYVLVCQDYQWPYVTNTHFLQSVGQRPTQKHTGQTRIHPPTHSLTLSDSSEWPINLTCKFWDDGKKPK